MATTDYLLNKITNPELRAKLQSEIDRIQKQKRFGLVFEDHLPEATLLYDVDVRRGQKVTLKDAPLKQKFEVVSISNGVAQCVSLDDKEEQTEINVDELVSYANLQPEAPVYSFGVNELLPYADFGDPIYPYLQPLDKIKNAPDSSLWHEVIEADNYHALQLLAYLYPGQVDCIYIDPPYNTGARDWKYNNDYVDSNDSYRHSKWLSMMRKRLLLAKKLLNPQDSVLIVTIDEKEYNHLGCLLEELFPNANIQMISSNISRKGAARTNSFTRVNEFIYFVMFGNYVLEALDNADYAKKGETIHWQSFRRSSASNKALINNHDYVLALLQTIKLFRENSVHNYDKIYSDVIELGKQKNQNKPNYSPIFSIYSITRLLYDYRGRLAHGLGRIKPYVFNSESLHVVTLFLGSICLSVCGNMQVYSALFTQKKNEYVDKHIAELTKELGLV